MRLLLDDGTVLHAHGLYLQHFSTMMGDLLVLPG